MKDFLKQIRRLNQIQHAINVSKETNKVAMSQPKVEPTPVEPQKEITPALSDEEVNEMSMKEYENPGYVDNENEKTEVVKERKKRNKEVQNDEQ